MLEGFSRTEIKTSGARIVTMQFFLPKLRGDQRFSLALIGAGAGPEPGGTGRQRRR